MGSVFTPSSRAQGLFLERKAREEEAGYLSNAGEKVASFTRREIKIRKLINQQGLIHSLSRTRAGTG